MPAMTEAKQLPSRAIEDELSGIRMRLIIAPGGRQHQQDDVTGLQRDTGYAANMDS